MDFGETQPWLSTHCWYPTSSWLYGWASFMSGILRIRIVFALENATTKSSTINLIINGRKINLIDFFLAASECSYMYRFIIDNMFNKKKMTKPKIVCVSQNKWLSLFVIDWTIRRSFGSVVICNADTLQNVQNRLNDIWKMKSIFSREQKKNQIGKKHAIYCLANELC